ncbi:hypothetical protein P3T22_005400 [Paraburkholderia sp. GAS348]
MIVRPGQNWFRLLFVWNGSVLQSIIPQLVFMAAVSSLADPGATSGASTGADDGDDVKKVHVGNPGKSACRLRRSDKSH